MKPKNVTNIEEYIGLFPKNTQKKLLRLYSFIKEIVPTIEETISYGMPAFKLHGKPLVYFAGYNNHIGFYALPSGNKAFQKELSNYKTGKGSIQFPIDEELPWQLIEQIVKYRIKEVEINKKTP
tara:strand:+ start:1815 stop:2186 length:372 start_codon:yes stop_codon:yes gene_type:complete